MGKLFYKCSKLPNRLLRLNFLCPVLHQVNYVVQRRLSTPGYNDLDIPLDQHFAIRSLHGGISSLRGRVYAVQSPIQGKSFRRNKRGE